MMFVYELRMLMEEPFRISTSSSMRTSSPVSSRGLAVASGRRDSESRAVPDALGWDVAADLFVSELASPRSLLMPGCGGGLRRRAGEPVRPPQVGATSRREL